MSFAEKLTSLMSRPGANDTQKDENIPWWLRVAGRVLGTVGSFIAIFLGLLNCTGLLLLNVSSVLAGIWQMLAGFLVIVIEAPMCCFFIDYVQALSTAVEAKPLFFKAALYVGLAIPPFFIYCGLTTIFGSGLIFATGIVYGMMALGKKASIEEMRSSASMEAGTLPSATTGANLVTNEQPTSFTRPMK